MILGLPNTMKVLINWLIRLNLARYDVTDEGEIVHEAGVDKYYGVKEMFITSLFSFKVSEDFSDTTCRRDGR